MRIDNSKAKELRQDFPIFSSRKNLVYLDNAATTQKPEAVIDAISDYYKSSNAKIHRGVYKLSQEATEKYEASHKQVENFIGAGNNEVVFTRNATESINLVSYGFDRTFKGKNDIVLTEMEHHSNMVPWQQFAKRNNLRLKYIRVKEDFTLDYDDAEKKITDKTAIVAASHISNALGTVNDVKMICSLAAKSGALSLVDGAQGAAHSEVDVKSIGCDFYAFSGHKMLGPTGTGVLYGKKELLEAMAPFNFGGDMISKVTYEDAEWNSIPMKFEAGTPNISGGIALSEAIGYLKKAGMKSIERWENDLLKYAMENMKNVKKYNPGLGKSAGILSFNLDNVHAHDVASILDMHDVCIRGGHHCAMPLMNKLGVAGTARASFYLYNTYEDIDMLVKGINEAEKVFRR